MYFAGSSGTSSSNGSVLCQNVSNSLTQMAGAAPSASQFAKTKSTFSDDMHQLVDNFARDAKKGPKTGAPATLGVDVSLEYRFSFKVIVQVYHEVLLKGCCIPLV